MRYTEHLPVILLQLVFTYPLEKGIILHGAVCDGKSRNDNILIEHSMRMPFIPRKVSITYTSMCLFPSMNG